MGSPNLVGLNLVCTCAWEQLLWNIELWMKLVLINPWAYSTMPEMFELIISSTYVKWERVRDTSFSNSWLRVIRNLQRHN